MDKKSPTIPIIITIILILALCCIAICLVIFASGAAFFINDTQVSQPIDPLFEQPTPSIFGFETQEPALTDDPTPLPSLTGAGETLTTLQEEEVPIADSIDLAQRLGGKSDIPDKLPDTSAPYKIGDGQDFWVTNVDTNENFVVNTTLRYLGEHTYIWIEDGVNYDDTDLIALGDTFDQEIYPTNRDFFGSEWSPGVDEDPHIYIVYAGGLGYSLAGYFSSADELHPAAHEYSNAHEMFLINSDNVYLGDDYVYGTLAHEFQHMIHWYTDMNEETWLNEGFSMLAELINGFDPGGFDYSYIINPDLQLTDWGTEVGDNGPHYGAAMLFTTYFLDRFGEDATKAVVAHDANGMESIDIVLKELDIKGPLTEKIITAEDVFADWAVANLLGDSQVADGRFHYNLYPDAPTASAGTRFPNCPAGPASATVSQFGVDYVEILCRGDYTINFTGNIAATILPTNPYSGDYFFWSNMGDHSNMSLQRDFDLTQVSAPVEMTYQTWYDLEEDYDYVFVSGSTDGETWQILNSTSCTRDNPSGNSYGCGLNGKSSGWQQETLSLDMYAGQNVTLRFDYVTDAAVNGVGMVIDDIRVEAIDYFTDFETDAGGWQAAGFVRIQNALPQYFRVSLIRFGDEITATPLVIDELNQANFTISSSDEVDSVMLVISGTTPYTRQKATYQIGID